MLKLAAILLINVACVYSFEDMTVYEYLMTHNFDKFVSLLQASGQDALLQTTGPFTVLAPTNAAIDNVPLDTMASLTSNSFQMKQLVKYHVVKGYVLTPQLHQGSFLTSVEGQTVLVDRVQGAVVLNNVSHITGSSDVICNNGVVQPIDAVLLPPVFGYNNLMQELVLKDKLFNEFTLAIIGSNLTDLLKTTELTVFAPTDTAWGKHYQQFLHPAIHVPNMRDIYFEMLKYHIVPGSRAASMLHNGEQLYTIHGTPLNITIDAKGDVRLNKYVKVIDADLPATNGMIHAIDDLLFPLDQLEILKQAYYAHHNMTAPRA